MVANAREFLLAIKETTHTVFDEDAVEFLENLREFASQSLDTTTGLHRHERDGIMFFEGMLRGVQVKLKKPPDSQEPGLFENGVPKLGEN